MTTQQQGTLDDGIIPLLDQAIACLKTESSVDGQRLIQLKDRLQEGRLNLAVLGQFKRGKSTLLNALLGQEILPTAVVPLTSIPTFIRSGEMLSVYVYYVNGRPPDVFHWPELEFCRSLSRYVTESGNPGNRLDVAHIEVRHSAAFLRRGVVLIDTPGIGSTFRHNTETTLQFLPQCDAAVFLVSADPPLTEVEIDFLKAVRGRVSRLFFVMNKVDYLSTSERDEAVEFLKNVLREQAGLGPDITIHCVSARQGLLAKLTNDPVRWAESGMKCLEKYIFDFLLCEKSSTLTDAVSSKAVNILEDELLRLQLAIRSRLLPIDDLKARLVAFTVRITQIEREMTAATDLLRGEKERMRVFIEEFAKSRREKARKYLQQVVRDKLGKIAIEDSLAEAKLREDLGESVSPFFDRELRDTNVLFRQKMAEILRPHQERSDDLIKAVRQTAADLFEIPYRAFKSSEAYHLRREPYWVTGNWFVQLHVIPIGFFDRFLTQTQRKLRMEKRMLAQIDKLVIRNVENLRWETLQSVYQTVDRFIVELGRRMAETNTATQGAIIAAMFLRERQSKSVAPDIARLDQAVEELTCIKGQILSLRHCSGR